jgi:hypothetical protein
VTLRRQTLRTFGKEWKWKSMQPQLTLYQDCYWNYENPFAIETDPFEELVRSRVAHFGVKKSSPRFPRRDLSTSPRLQATRETGLVPEGPNRRKRRRIEDSVRSQMRKSAGQQFVSSDTKPLKKQPRVTIHLPASTAKVLFVDRPTVPFSQDQAQM